MTSIDFDVIPEEAVVQFLADVRDNLDLLEVALLHLEKDQNNQDWINQIFRATHSIKGAAGMYGYGEMERLTHLVESVYVKVKRGELRVDENLISLTLQARDLLERLLANPGQETLPDQLRLRFEALLPTPAPIAPRVAATNAEPTVAGRTNYRILFRFDPEKPIFLSGTNPLWCLDALAEFGPHRIIPRLDQLPRLQDLVVDRCFIYWEIELATTANATQIQDEFEFVQEELAELLITTSPDLPVAESRCGNEVQMVVDRTSRPLKILIADDEFPNRLLLKKMLTNCGECDMVVDGNETVEIFALALAEGDPYDLILLDIMMPGMDGHAALQEIRRLEREQQITPLEEAVVIMVTALDTPKHVFRAYYQGGCSDYLAKPVTQEKLLAKLWENGLLENPPFAT